MSQVVCNFSKQNSSGGLSPPARAGCRAERRARGRAAASARAEAAVRRGRPAGRRCLDRRRLEGPHGHPLAIRSPSLWAVPAGTRTEGLD